MAGRISLKLLAGLALLASAGVAQAKQYDVLVFSQPIAGEEAAFAKAQLDGRIPAALKIPGFKTAQRFEMKEADTGPTIAGNYVVMYGVDTDDIAAATAALAKLGAAQDELANTIVTYELIRSMMNVPKDVPGGDITPLPVPGKSDLKHFFLFACLSAGQGDANVKAFNDMYDNNHLPDVLRNPGFLWGQRGQLVSVQPSSRPAAGYMAIYEFQSYDLAASIGEVVRRLKVGTTRAFPKGSVGGPAMVFYALPVGAALHN